jgi:Mn-dependent DtxR family transcriptional regulator
MANDEPTPALPERVGEETPPPGIVTSTSLAAYAAESVVEVGVSVIPFAGGPLTLAWEKGLARRETRAQRDRDYFLYRLSLCLQAQVDHLGEQLDSLAGRLDDPVIQDLIAQGVDASAGKTDPEIGSVAEAVGRVIGARGGDIDEEAPALLDIVSHLREGDVVVLRSLVTAVRPGDTRTTDDISELLSVGALRVQAALLRLDAADLVNRLAGTGESVWTPTRLGVQVAVAMGETAVQTLADGWTQADADLLTTLIEIDLANPSAIPSLDNVAEQLGRTAADLDASGQVLEGAGYVTRQMTMGSPYAHALILQDSAHFWKAEQDHDGLVRTVNELTEALRAVPDGQLASSQDLANQLNLHPRLVQALLRRLVRTGYLKQLNKEPRGPLHVMPTEKLRRSALSDTDA